MAEKIEKLGRYETQKSRRELKRRTHRKERRESKRLLEDAPKRREFRGWSD